MAKPMSDAELLRVLHVCKAEILEYQGLLRSDYQYSWEDPEDVERRLFPEHAALLKRLDRKITELETSAAVWDHVEAENKR